jgi:hypothetical protein
MELAGLNYASQHANWLGENTGTVLAVPNCKLEQKIFLRQVLDWIVDVRN